MTANKVDSPSVFVSYCWTSTPHQNWVLTLAERLRSDGVNIILDKWDLKEGQDKHAFMESMVTDPNVKKVLIICDKRYKEKADNREGGVGTESQIISDEVYNKVAQTKFIPILSDQDTDGKPNLPVFLKSRIFINLSKQEAFEEEYEKLLFAIFDKPLYKKPPLGTPPSFITDEAAPQILTLHKFSRVKDAITNNKSYSESAIHDFFDTFVEALETFRISSPVDDKFDDIVVNNIERFKPYTDQFAECVRLFCCNSAPQAYYDILFDFLEECLRFLNSTAKMVSWEEEWFANYRFIMYELFLYLIAILIKYRRFNEADFFIREPYFYKSRNEQKTSQYVVFFTNLRIIDVYRNQRLFNNGRFAVSADIISQRITLPWLKLDDIMQADFVLSLRCILHEIKPIWFPKVCVFGDKFYQGFEIFYKAQAHRKFESIKVLLNIVDKADLKDRFGKAKVTYNLDHWRYGLFNSVPFETWMALDKLDTI
jgi:SEFIR domain.